MLYKPLDLPYKHNTYDGVPVQNFITSQRMEEIKNIHQSRFDDIYIATFMKSGTTWLQNLVYEILDRPQGEYENINLAVPWLEEESQSFVDNLVSPRIFKTRDRWEWIPKGDGIKYIYCYRNPKDVVVSYYHHMKMFDGHYGYEGSFDEFVSDICLKYNCVVGGCYFEQVAKWLYQKNNSNILYITYEDMTEDLKRETKRISQFLNVNLEDEKLELICNNSTFSAMQKNDKTNYSWREG